MIAELDRRMPHAMLEKLAARLGHPRELIERLYLDELENLEREARIITYVPLVALGRVREALRREPAPREQP